MATKYSLVILCLILGFSALPAAGATSAPPALRQSFDGSTVTLQGTARLTFTIDNPNAAALTGIGFSDSLLPGLAVGAPGNVANTCGGSNSAAPGATLVSLTGATLAAASSCTFSFNVTATLTGTQASASSAIVSIESGRGSGSAASINVTAKPATVSVTIATTPAGLAVIIDGVSYSSTQQMCWTVGSAHTISGFTQFGGGQGTQYVFTGWSDSGAATHTIVAPAAPVTYQAAFKRQFLFEAFAAPGGAVTPQEGYFDEGSLVPVTATPAAGYVFSGFSVGLSGTTPSQTLTMTQPTLVQAAFMRSPANIAQAFLSGSAAVGSTFANPLQVRVTDAAGNGVGGAPVLFSAPDGGASATLSPRAAVTDAQGIARVTAAANNVVGSYQVTVSVASLSSAFSLTNTALVQSPSIVAVVPATNSKTGLAAGALLTLYGSALSDTASTAASNPLPVTLGVTSLEMNGAPVPLLYVDGQQINFQAPAGVIGKKISLVARRGSAASAPFVVTMEAAAPSIFLADGVHAAGVNAAAAGGYFTIYATGLGVVSAPVLDGQRAPLTAPWSMVLSPIGATIGGEPATVDFAGLAPGFVGLSQVNLIVPQLPAGDYPLVITVFDAGSNAASNAAVVTVKNP